MNVGVVGSRRRNGLFDAPVVCGLLNHLLAKDPTLVVVSGGCEEGADRFAHNWARALNVDLIEHLPDIPPGWKPAHKGEAAEPFYARNKLVARDSDILFALVTSDRKGGTENTIKWANQKGIPVFIHDGTRWIRESVSAKPRRSQ